MTLSTMRSTISRLLRTLAVLVTMIVAPAPSVAQDALGPFPGAVTGPGFVVRYGEGDSLRAQAVAEALAAQSALPAIPDTLPRGVTVVLAPNEELFRRASGGRPPEWSAGVAIPSLNRIVLPPFGSDRSRGGNPWRTLRHEWAHLGLRQALPVMRGMLDGTRPSSGEGRYDIREAVNSPSPVQKRLPILVGGTGHKVTLRLVAEHGDMCNLIGSPDQVAAAEAKLLEHCETVGRNPREIERTVAIRQPVIRDSRQEADKVLNEIFAHNGSDPWSRDTVGTPDDLAENLAPYVELGYRHLIFQFLAPFDSETMERLALEVRPRLEELTS